MRFNSPRLAAAAAAVTVTARTEKESGSGWTTSPPTGWPGLYTVRSSSAPGPTLQTTNELPLTLAPRITGRCRRHVAARGRPSAEIDATCARMSAPPARGPAAGRPRGLRPSPILPADQRPDVQVKHAPLGEPFLRLRIDGVDSLLVASAGHAAGLRRHPEGDDP